MTTKEFTVLMILIFCTVLAAAGYFTDHKISESTSTATTTPKIAPEATTTVTKTASDPFGIVKSDPNSFSGKLIVLTNAERKSPLKESAVLDQRATNRAYIVCQLPFDESAHDSFYAGGIPSSRSILSDLSNATAENLAQNFSDEVSTNIAFMASRTHRANIQDEYYKYMGVGHVTCPENQYGNDSVTVEFFTGPYNPVN